MNKATILILIFVIILSSSVLAIIYLPVIPACDDHCSENVRYYNGSYDLESKECEYMTEECFYKCEDGACVLPDIYPVDLTPDEPELQTILEEGPQEIVQSSESEVYPCNVDSDGKDYFTAGKVGRLIKHAKLEIVEDKEDEKDGVKVADDMLTPLLIHMYSPDTCKDKDTLNESYCVFGNLTCITEDNIATLRKLGILNDTQVEYLSAAVCVSDPYLDYSGQHASTTYKCKCGCEDGACLSESDEDKDGIVDCIDEDAGKGSVDVVVDEEDVVIEEAGDTQMIESDQSVEAGAGTPEDEHAAPVGVSQDGSEGIEEIDVVRDSSPVYTIIAICLIVLIAASIIIVYRIRKK